MEIRFKKLIPEAKLPTQGKPGDAAYDIYCAEDFELQPGETKAIATGLQLADMPTMFGKKGPALFLQIEGRSGLAAKGIFPLGGIIDATYRGEIKVILHNGNPEHSFDFASPIPWWTQRRESVKFKVGDRIAQLLVRLIASDVTMVEAEEATETVRGSDGFGSTGQ
jgi:dUTP pyrophosphatase